MTPDCEALVIGGGVAGAAVAVHLASAGHDVILCEREAGAHDKVCGEFISVEGVHALQQLGICTQTLGGLPIDRISLSHRERTVATRLPFTAQSLSRRALDAALLQRAAGAGAQIRHGSHITALRSEGDIWRAVVSRGGAITSRSVFLATGKHDLRGWKRPPGTQSDLIGFKTYWQLEARQHNGLRGRIELILFAGGYAGLQCVEGGRANLCLVIRRQAFAKALKNWDQLLAGLLRSSPRLQQHLANAVCLSEKPLCIAGIPYGYVAAAQDGVWRLGDQAAVIPSFSGDGMSIALHSAGLASRHYLSDGPAAVYQAEMASLIGAQIWRSTLLSQLLVSCAGQFGAISLARLAPAVLSWVAQATRIPA